MSILHTLFDAILSRLNTNKPSNAAFSTEEKKYEYYAFISYKHEENGRFANDAAWAKALERELIRLHIPTGISEEERIASNDDSVNPIFRDGSILSIIRKGLLPNMLEQKLRGSKTLVLILSQQMIEDQNNKYNPDPRKNQAWIYWEVKTFLKYHNYDWARVIPVYVDPQDYLPSKLRTSIKIESNFDNIEKPWHDYKQEYNWDTQKTELYRRTAASVASNIFRAEKDAFWNLKEKEREAVEAEKRKNHVQKILWVIISLFALSVALVGLTMMMKNQSENYLAQARIELNKGNRHNAGLLATDAYKKWKWTAGIPELIWDSMDSTSSYICVNSRIHFDEYNNQMAYIDNNREVVFVNLSSLDEVDRLDLGAIKDFIISGDGNTIVGFRPTETVVYNRSEKTWDSFSKVPDYSHETLINKKGDRIVFPSKAGSLAHFRGASGEYYLEPNLGQEFEHMTLHKKESSFMELDSLLIESYVFLDGLNKYGLLLLYNLSQRPDGNVIHPVNHILNKGDIINSFLSPVSNAFYIQTLDSLVRYTINVTDSVTTLKRLSAVQTDLEISEIRFREGFKNVLLIDADGAGYVCSNDWSQTRIGDAEGFTKTKPGEIPIMLNWADNGQTNEGYYILRYGTSDDYINIKDPKKGFHIAPLVDRDVIRGQHYNGITAITVSHNEHFWHYDNYTSYVFTRGDKRKLSFYGLNAFFLSSQYVVHNSFRLFKDRHSSSRSAALYDPQNDSLILDISQKSDISMDLVKPCSYVLGTNYIAALVEYANKAAGIRIYSLDKKQLIIEISIDNTSHVQLYGWMNDILLYSTMKGLNRIKKNEHDVFESSFISDIYNYNLKCDSDKSVFPFSTSGWNKKWGWYDTVSDQTTILEQNEQVVVNSRGSEYASIIPKNNRIIFVNPHSRDTLKVVNTEKPVSGICSYCKDDRLFIYSTSDGKLKCLTTSDYQEQWSLSIWKPSQYSFGKRLAVFVSSSIYVIDLQSGRIKYCFNRYPMYDGNLVLSKDEDYLIFNGNLYDLRSGQQVSKRLPRNVKSVENGYIVCDDQMIKLPKMRMLLND